MSLSDEHPTFRTVRMREGYDRAEVDDFLEQARAALAYDPPLMRTHDVENQRFNPVRMREGYDMGEVDDYLDRLAGELRRREVPGDTGAADPQPSVVQRQSSPPWVALLVVAVLVVVVLLLVR